jgi:hypothetical protein
LPQDQDFCFQLCSRLEERSQYAENQLEQILHPVANLPPLFSASMLNRIFGTHRHMLPLLVGIGLAVGALSGFFGIGGGFLIVPG